MAKLNKRLQDLRDPYILMMFNDMISAEDIGEIIGLSTSAVWEVLRREKARVERDN
jgi:hypothetical protein